MTREDIWGEEADHAHARATFGAWRRLRDGFGGRLGLVESAFDLSSGLCCGGGGGREFTMAIKACKLVGKGKVIEGLPNAKHLLPMLVHKRGDRVWRSNVGRNTESLVVSPFQFSSCRSRRCLNVCSVGWKVVGKVSQYAVSSRFLYSRAMLMSTPANSAGQGSNELSSSLTTSDKAKACLSSPASSPGGYRKSFDNPGEDPGSVGASRSFPSIAMTGT